MLKAAKASGIASALRRPGVEDVAEAVPEQIESQHGETDREAGEDRDHRMLLHMVAGDIEIRAPVRCRRRRAEAKERECSDDQDHVAEPNRCIDDQRRDAVWKDLPRSEEHTSELQ